MRTGDAIWGAIFSDVSYDGVERRGFAKRRQLLDIRS